MSQSAGVAQLVSARDRCLQLEGDQEGLTALRLEVTDWGKAEETLSALGRARHLRELSLISSCGDEEVGRMVKEVLLANSSLQRLTLDLRECSDHGTTHLAELMEKMATVKHLTLMLNKVTSRGAEVLAASLPLSSLLSLTLYATQIDLHDLCVGDEGARHFASSLPHTRHLTSFGLTQSGVTPTGLGYLLRGLEQNSKITSLNLHSNFIDGTGAADVARFLSTNSGLKQLILNENHYIGDEGARELAVALSHNASLEVLSLKSCGIGRRGAERFAGPLETNSTLRVLNLCGNGDIGDDGIEMIARGLRGNSGLEQLDLSSCGVSDEGCDHLADALGTTGTTLTHITLHRNTISDGGAISLAHTLTKNSCLVVLVLSENPVGEKGVSALGQALEHNTTITTLVLGQGERGTRSPLSTRSRRNGEQGRRQQTDSRTGTGPPVPRGAVTERGGIRSKRVMNLSSDGVQRCSSTLALVEALVSKNRKMAAYRKTVRELRERVRELEKERRDRTQ